MMRLRLITTALLIWQTGCRQAALDSDSTASVPPTATDEREWVQINYHPCALASDGSTQCWQSARWREMNPSFNLFPTPEHEPLSEFSADTSYYWGIGRDSGLAVRLFVPGNLGPEPTVGYTEPAGVCGLLNGRIDCFDSIPDSRDESLTLLDGWRLYAGLTVDNVLIGITNTGSDPQDIPLTRPVVEIMTFEPSTRCVLYEEGDVECFGPLEVTFPDPPYVDISGGGWHGCASKETGVLDCSGGRQVDFGEPLRDFVVTQDDIFEKAPGWDEGDERYIGRLPTVEDDPFICAITESNAIRCTGWRYEFSDLQNALPRGYYGAWR